jgi:hypothetical protein
MQSNQVLLVLNTSMEGIFLTQILVLLTERYGCIVCDFFLQDTVH